MRHPTFAGRALHIGDWIKTSNPRSPEWQQITSIRWIRDEGVVWIHVGDSERQSAECIVDRPRQDYSHVIAVDVGR